MKRLLALLAVSFLLLRPFCDAWAVYGHVEPVRAEQVAVGTDAYGVDQHPGDLCCSGVQAGNLVPTSETPIASEAAMGAILVAVTRNALVGGGGTPRGVRLSAEPPPTRLSYYARSARILR